MNDFEARMRTHCSSGIVKSPALGTLGVVLVNGLGDCLLAVPVVRALRACSSKLITVVPPGQSYEAVLLELSATAAHIDAIGQPHLSRWDIDVEQAFAILRCCDHVMFMIDWDSCQLEVLRARLANVGVRTFTHPFRRGFKRPDGREMHQLERNVELAQAACGDWLVPLRLPHECAARPASRIVSIHPETSVLEKTYPVAAWANLIDAIGDSVPDGRIFVHGLRYAERVISCCTTAVTPALGTVYESLEVAARSSLLLGVDSYLLHYTDLIGVPAVALFRSTDPCRWGPYFTRASRVHELQNLREPDTVRALVRQVQRLLQL